MQFTIKQKNYSFNYNKTRGSKCENLRLQCFIHFIHKIYNLFPFHCQAKYEFALNKSVLKIVTPDWLTDTIRNQTVCNESLYHPRLLVFPKASSPSSTSKFFQVLFMIQNYVYYNCS